MQEALLSQHSFRFVPKKRPATVLCSALQVAAIKCKAYRSAQSDLIDCVWTDKDGCSDLQYSVTTNRVRRPQNCLGGRFAPGVNPSQCGTAGRDEKSRRSLSRN